MNTYLLIKIENKIQTTKFPQTFTIKNITTKEDLTQTKLRALGQVHNTNGSGFTRQRICYGTDQGSANSDWPRGFILPLIKLVNLKC